jgi:dethiobiotin synthetase/adenosylmethionine--8-amino-7-oxononanoate aminotransferase
LQEAFNVEKRLSSDLYGQYRETIETSWAEYEQSGCLLGAVFIRSLFIGTDDTILVDPLWQRALVDVARTRDVPIILDERAASIDRRILGCEPDILVCGDVVTGGGVASLGATLASEKVHKAFTEAQTIDGKDDTSNHGNTVYPHAYISALHTIESSESIPQTGKSIVDEEQMKSLSLLPSVSYCFALGNSFVLVLNTEDKLQSVLQGMRGESIYVGSQQNPIHIQLPPFTESQQKFTDVLIALHKVLS